MSKTNGQSAAKLLSINIRRTFIDYPGMEYTQVSGNGRHLKVFPSYFMLYLEHKQ